MTLYSYCLRYDDGAAPNPYWGKCTLVICKPAIRRTAQVGDWVIGLGSAHSVIGDISGSVVYAMRVTERLSMKEYDEYCQEHLSEKLPDWRHKDFRRRVGDCIYDYSKGGKPKLRPSVHGENNRATDLRGENALLSTHFFYFGIKPEELPSNLKPLVHRTQGHKSRANSDYVDEFVAWIEGLGYKPCHAHAEPQLKSKILATPDFRMFCAAQDETEDRDDDIC